MPICLLWKANISEEIVSAVAVLASMFTKFIYTQLCVQESNLGRAILRKSANPHCLLYFPAVIPSIVSLPAPVTYLGDLTSSSPTLSCEVWPPTANISLYLAHPSIASHPGPSLGGPQRSPLALEPIPNGSSSAPFSISRRLVPGNFTTSSMATAAVPAFSNAVVNLEVVRGERDGGADMWRRVDSVDVHCRADTEFGAVLSAPFRVVQSSKHLLISSSFIDIPFGFCLFVLFIRVKRRLTAWIPFFP